MKFKSWRDYYIFIRDYVKYSCLNCKFGGAKVDTDKENSDGDYARLFCTFNIAMVRLDFQTLCAEWTDADGHGLPWNSEFNFKFPKELDDVFDADNEKEWSIEEIKDVIKDYESKRTDG